MPAFLYAMRNPVTGAIKIGFSVAPEIRLIHFQKACGIRLELLAKKRAYSGRDEERVLHRRLRDSRIMYEWFAPTEDVHAVVAELQS